MRPTRLISSGIITLSLLSACSSMQQANPTLDQARNEYSAAQSNAQVTTYAPAELKQSGDALQIANDAWEHRDNADKVDELAYVAKQKVALTVAVAHQRAAEVAVANATKERDQMRLDQRTMQADQATARAQQEAARAQQLEQSLRELAAKKTDHGVVITLGDVLFVTNRADLTAGGVRSVQKLAEVLLQFPERHAVIDGFTDSTGSASHNQDLSERRADAVRALLIGMNIAPDRIATHGYGDERPVASNSTADGRQQNRRVEITLSDENGKVSMR